jgi:PAS domain S-box-containing protein
LVEDIEASEQLPSQAQRFMVAAGTVLASSLDLKEILDHITSLAVSYMADWCSVNLFEPDGTIVRASLAHRDPDKAHWAQQLSDNYPIRAEHENGVAQVRRTGKALLFSALDDEMLRRIAHDDQHFEFFIAAELRSAMIVPLFSRGTAFGCITFVSCEPGHYSARDLAVAEDFGRQAGLAIDNARLYMATRKELEERARAEELRIRAAEEVRLLYEAGRALGRSLDPHVIYNTMQGLVSSVMDCNGLLVSSFSEEDDLIRCSYAWVEGEKLDPSSLPPIPLNRNGQGMQSQVIMTGEPLIFLDVEKRVEKKEGTYYHVTADGGVHEEPEPSSPTTKSVLMVPILIEEKTKGVVQVMSHRANAYGDDQLRILEGLVLQMAAATRNAVLYQQAQAEIQERQRAENRYRSLVSAITSVVWDADGSRCFVRAQPSWEAFTGQTWDEYHDEGWLEAIHPEDRARAERGWRRCVEQRTVYEAEYRLWHQETKRYRHVATRAVPLFDQEGNIEEWLGTATDVHEARVAQEQAGFLLALNDRIRDIVDPNELLREVVWTLGTRLGVARCWYADVHMKDGNVEVHEEYLNGGASAIGRHALDQENPKVMEDLCQGTPVVVQNTAEDHRTRDSKDAYEAIELRSYVSVPIVRSNELQGVLALYDRQPREWSPEEVELCEEVAERTWLAIQNARARAQILELNRDLEHRVSERTHQLEAANHEMEGFTYTVAHDLRAPLRAIVSTSMILMQDYGDRVDAEMRSLLERQAAAAKQLGILVDDLLKLSRIGRTELSKRSIDLSELAAEVASDLQQSPESPTAQEPEFVIQPGLIADADPQLLRLVLQNLFENSLKFARKGVPPRIEVSAAAEGSERVFAVRDNGIGFDQQYVQKIFEPFERLHRQGEYPGTGVGLANVKRIVHRHGGRIWAEGREHEGAAFFFTL